MKKLVRLRYANYIIKPSLSTSLCKNSKFCVVVSGEGRQEGNPMFQEETKPQPPETQAQVQEGAFSPAPSPHQSGVGEGEKPKHVVSIALPFKLGLLGLRKFAELLEDADSNYVVYVRTNKNATILYPPNDNLSKLRSLAEELTRLAGVRANFGYDIYSFTPIFANEEEVLGRIALHHQVIQISTEDDKNKTLVLIVKNKKQQGTKPLSDLIPHFCY
ncbi:MAG: hypothetical protein QN229_07320 [Desulfurococcaceae archaeon TW002]